MWHQMVCIMNLNWIWKKKFILSYINDHIQINCHFSSFVGICLTFATKIEMYTCIFINLHVFFVSYLAEPTLTVLPSFIEKNCCITNLQIFFDNIVCFQFRMKIHYSGLKMPIKFWSSNLPRQKKSTSYSWNSQCIFLSITELFSEFFGTEILNLPENFKKSDV